MLPDKKIGATPPQATPKTLDGVSGMGNATNAASATGGEHNPNDTTATDYYDDNHGTMTHIGQENKVHYMFSSDTVIDDTTMKNEPGFEGDTSAGFMNYNDNDGVNAFGKENDATYDYSTTETPHHNMTDADNGTDGNKKRGFDHVSNVPEDPDMDELMKDINDRLKDELSTIDKSVKRVFKELVAFKTTSAEIIALLTPLQEAEHAEAARLDELQAEIDGTVNMAFARSSK
jgi:hypothetical protein